jgi:hypothetical protein
VKLIPPRTKGKPWEHIFSWWQVWKERNRRIFEEKELSIPQLSAILNDQIHLFQAANLPSAT